MRTYSECNECFLKQASRSADIAGIQEKEKDLILEEVREKLTKISTKISPPQIARKVYDIIEKYTKNIDIYKELKEKSNNLALGMYPNLEKIISKSKDPLLTAIKIAAVGNVIDYGVLHAFNLADEIDEFLKKDFAVFDYILFKKELDKAETILYILDNSGEIVFDKLLIQELGKKVICAVREVPIINDVTMEDAKKVGLHEVAEIISSGSTLPGTYLGGCDKKFIDIFEKSDMIISKGQGNYETLESANREIFFIFKAKCAVVARHMECKIGDFILYRNKEE